MGKASKTLAGALGQLGRTVALVERSPQLYGGTWVNIACVPTKALIHHAESRRDDDPPESWFTTSVRHRDTLIDKLNARNHAILAEVGTVTLVDGQARFVAAHQVEVTGGADRLLIDADTVVVNSSRATENTATLPCRPSGTARSCRSCRSWSASRT